MFGSDYRSHRLHDANFGTLKPLTHVLAKMDHRKGAEKQFWHHGVYCGSGEHLLMRAVLYQIDLTKYHVPVGESKVLLGAFLQEHFDTPLICEYDGPQANGQLSTSSSSPSFKGRVTLNACSSWRRLYRVVYYNEYARTHLSEEQILRNLFESIGREKYSVVFSNCEHHTTGVLKGIEESKQVQLGVGAVLAGAVALLGAAGLAAWAGTKGREEEARWPAESERRDEGDSDSADEAQPRKAAKMMNAAGEVVDL